MPYYPYRCKKCEREFSICHSMVDKKTDCPLCESKDSLVRLISAFTVDKPAEGVRNNGDIVKKSIEEYKESLKEQIEELKEQSNEFTN